MTFLDNGSHQFRKDAFLIFPRAVFLGIFEKRNHPLIALVEQLHDAVQKPQFGIVEPFEYRPRRPSRIGIIFHQRQYLMRRFAVEILRVFLDFQQGTHAGQQGRLLGQRRTKGVDGLNFKPLGIVPDAPALSFVLRQGLRCKRAD